jgi:hypothetical protein
VHIRAVYIDDSITIEKERWTTGHDRMPASWVWARK